MTSKILFAIQKINEKRDFKVYDGSRPSQKRGFNAVNFVSLPDGDMNKYFRSDQDEKKRSGSSVSFDKEAIAKNRGSVRLQSGKLSRNTS